jgi:DNA-binding response OmpR family regulator
MKILLLEDDEVLRETLEDELSDAGFSVDATASSDEASELSYNNSYNLYLFDVEVLGMSGFELLTQLRQSGDTTPAIFLTAKTQVSDMMQGFESGADDYIKKPFDMQELLIRIASRTKRFKQQWIDLGENITLNTESLVLKTATSQNQLHKKEFEILYYYIENSGRVIAKDEVINALYEEEPISDATFRVYIKNIKKAAGVEVLKNRRGVGYIFEKL